MPLNGRDPFDDSVIALYRASREVGAHAFQVDALERLGEDLPFDFAVWSRAALEDGVVRLYSAMDLRLPAGAMQALARIEDHDVLGAAAFASLGRTIIASPVRGFTDDPVLVEQLIEPFDISHLLTTCLVDPFTSLISSVTVGRKAASGAFTEADRLLKERFTPHLVEAYTACRLLGLLQWRGGAGPSPYAVAVCDREGLLEFASQEFSQLMAREWPDWRGPRLPRPVMLDSTAPGRQVLEQVTLRSEPSGGAILLRIRSRQPVDTLSARETEIAHLSAVGRSNKEIAKELTLSPFTVRNHLDSVYRKLGVAKRSELGALVGELSIGVAPSGIGRVAR